MYHSSHKIYHSSPDICLRLQQMGNLQFVNNKREHYKPNSKLSLPVQANSQELDTLNQLIHQRSLLRSRHLCTVARIHSHQPQTDYFCEQTHTVILEYQPFDHYLYELTSSFPLSIDQVVRIIHSVSLALMKLLQNNFHHGDIGIATICCFKGEWKLIDNFFIKGGITAYEKVLEGEGGFVSPAQMSKIRYGFLRESPPIVESDDVFALGMTCLQIMSGKSSKLCYKQSYIRFNQRHMDEVLSLIGSRYPLDLCHLVMSMLVFNEDYRITVKQILLHPLICQYSTRITLRK